MYSHCWSSPGFCRVWLTADSRMETCFKFLMLLVLKLEMSQHPGKVWFQFIESISQTRCFAHLFSAAHLLCAPLLKLLILSSWRAPSPMLKHLPLPRAGVGGSHSLIRQSKQSLSTIYYLHTCSWVLNSMSSNLFSSFNYNPQYTWQKTKVFYGLTL